MSDIYPRTLSRLPWCDRLLEYAGDMGGLQGYYLEACRQMNQVLFEQLIAVTPLESLQMRAERIDHLEMRWPDNPNPEGEGWHNTSSVAFRLLYINDREALEMLEIILPVLGVDLVDQESSSFSKSPLHTGSGLSSGRQ